MSRRRVWMTTKRLEKNLDQTELAKEVGVSTQTINSIELGNRNPSGPVALRLSKILDVDMEKFYEEGA